MSKEDIEKAQKEAEMHAEEDKKKKETIDAKNHLENAIYQAEKMPDEYKDKISDEDKETIKKLADCSFTLYEQDSPDSGHFVSFRTADGGSYLRFIPEGKLPEGV